MRPAVVTQQEVDNFNRPLRELSARLQANNKPSRRDSGTIRQAIENLKEPLNRFSRNLADLEQHRCEVVKALDNVNAKVAELKAAGAHPSKLADLVGYSFSSKISTDGKGFVNGRLQNLQEELSLTERQIETKKKAVANRQALCDREIPALEAELKESLRLERLGL